MALDERLPHALHRHLVDRRGAVTAQLRAVRLGIIATDFLTVLGVTLLAQFVRFGTTAGGLRLGLFETNYTLFSLLLAGVWMVILLVVRASDARILGAGLEEYSRVIRASSMFFGGLAIYSLVFQLEISRGYIAVAFPLGTFGLLLVRFCWRRWISTRRAAGTLTVSTLLIGRSDATATFARLLEARPELGYQIVAVASSAHPVESAFTTPHLVVRSAQDVADLVSQRGIAAVFMVDRPSDASPNFVREVLWALEGSGVELTLSPQLLGVAPFRLQFRPVNGLSLVHVEASDYTGLRYGAKRLFDIAASLLLLVLAAPVMIATAFAVKLDTPGPALFRQTRIGRDGRRFSMLKFRSMIPDAESRRAGLVNNADGLLFKVRRDPRTTRVGRTIRRLSIDELPQLFNVLRGEMSMVGPRPPLPEEVDSYESEVRRRLLVKPGLTGLWQVSGRSDLPWEEAVYLDLFYVENWSFIGDLHILLRTAGAVLRSRGAY